ncbi:MAG TPA: molybdopterin molybdotransferase MoeA [Thermoplasmata archaeon]|nr:molybdopterin molybdotransferase MoeA [Thermoplasmata archaeon]
MEMHAFGPLLPMEAARRRLLAAVGSLERVESVPVESGFGRVVARTVRSPRPVPSFHRATWDGYALRSDDARGARPSHPVSVHVVGEVFAEQTFPRALRRGQAVAIATGGALPRGADTVVNFENVDRRGGLVWISRPVGPGERLAAPGDDFPRGAVLVRRGEVLTPAGLAMVAACGLATVPVRPRPVVAILPNGNELLSPGAPTRVGRIYESNNASLAAIVEGAGGIAQTLPPVADDPRRIESALRRALRTADLVLVTGGSSVGERDHLPRIFPRMGHLLFHGVAVRPGRPTLAVRVGQQVIVGMPGHPSSCLTNAYWLLVPLIRRLGGREGPGWSDGYAQLDGGPLSATPGLSTVVPLCVRDGRVYSRYHGSSSVSSLSGAVGFTVLPPGRTTLRRGARVVVHWLLPPLGPGAGPFAPGNG